MKCPTCDGKGKVVIGTFLMIWKRYAECPKCKGRGWVWEEATSILPTCAACSATPPPQLTGPRVSSPGSSRVPFASAATTAERRREEERQADDSGDPLTAAIVAGALGGDPGTAALTTMATGNTGLGIMLGVMEGEQRHPGDPQFEGHGGNSGGAGASASFDNPPLIVDPFASSRDTEGQPAIEASAPEPDSHGPAEADDGSMSMPDSGSLDNSPSCADDTGGTAY